jgi:hypothetical protein
MGMALGRDSFTDLSTRILTGVAIAVVGLGAVWAGSPWFTLFVAAVIGVLVWELARMMGAPRDRALGLGASAGVLLLAAKLLPTGLGLPLLFITGFAGIAVLPRNRTLFLVISVLIMLASFGLITHRDTFGLTWMLWLVLLVAVTDIGGYFAGRIIGGPKFWPRVSPKKNLVGHGGGLGRGGRGRLGFHGGDRHGRGADRDFHRAQHGQPDGRYRGIGGEAERGRQGQLRPPARAWRRLGPLRRHAGRVAFASGDRKLYGVSFRCRLTGRRKEERCAGSAFSGPPGPSGRTRST